MRPVSIGASQLHRARSHGLMVAASGKRSRITARGTQRSVKREDISMVCRPSLSRTSRRFPVNLLYSFVFISRMASCLIGCGHRDKKEKLRSAQVVKEGGFTVRDTVARRHGRGHGQVTFHTVDPHTCSEHGQNGENIQGPASIQDGIGLDIHLHDIAHCSARPAVRFSNLNEDHRSCRSKTKRHEFMWAFGHRDRHGQSYM
jgi:hypothetical protein